MLKHINYKRQYHCGTDHITRRPHHWAVDSSTKKWIWFPKQIQFFVKLSTVEMMWSPCDVVSFTMIFSFIGDVCICQVIFKATGITSAMVPPEAARRIPHLLISTAENGISTHQTSRQQPKSLMSILSWKESSCCLVVWCTWFST